MGPLTLRRTPLQRRTPLKRKTALKSTPASAARPLKRGRKKRTGEGPMEPAEWRTHAAVRAGWRDEVTGEPLGHDWECHHVLPSRLLRQHGLAHLVWHPANAMALNAATHHAHESAMQRIPASALKPHHAEFARLAEAQDAGDWASSFLSRTYPVEPDA